jgi:hypothetical protein
VVGLASVETNAPAGGVVVEGVGVSPAADFADDGTVRASKHSNTIEILMTFDDMVSPHFCYLYSVLHENWIERVPENRGAGRYAAPAPLFSGFFCFVIF